MKFGILTWAEEVVRADGSQRLVNRCSRIRNKKYKVESQAGEELLIATIESKA